MGRTRKITDEQILEAARELFLSEGFGASTVEIAKRAGVSEGSIFKRFPTKERLFFAAMGGHEVPRWVENLKTLPGRGDLKENLVDISLQIVDFLREVLPRMMMIQSKGGLPPAPMPMAPEPPILRDVAALSRYFEAEIKLGRLRACDPHMAASTLIGALTNQVLIEQMPTPRPQPLDDFVHELVEFLWQGISPAS
jgi:AcrR family transcriptional regulator